MEVNQIMKNNKKQHTVPVSYLNRFAKKNDNNKGYNIGSCLKTKTGLKFFTESVNNVTCFDNCYDTKEHDDPKYWEHYFAKNNSQDGTAVIGIEEKKIISKLILFQYCRLPCFYEYHINRVVELIKAKYPNDSNDVNLEDLAKNEYYGIIAKNFISNNLDLLSGRYWIIYYNDTKIPFFTSDNPIIIYDFGKGELDYKSFGAGGFGRPYAMTIYPISSKIMIKIFPNQLDANFVIFQDCSKMILSSKTDENFIHKVNSLQICHSTNKAFFNPDFLESARMLYMKSDR